MKRDDSVFFFTLVDFLLTSLFFCLVIYVIVERVKKNDKAVQRGVEELATYAKASGVSSLTELTDRLTRLGPVKQIEREVDYVRHQGGTKQLERGQLLIREAGGTDSVAAALARLRRVEGYGKPPCVYTIGKDGRKIASNVATLIASDTMLSFGGDTPELTAILDSLGEKYADVQNLNFADFRRVFSPLLQRRADCRYWLRFVERTRYVDARDAAHSGFLLNIEKN